MGDDRNRLLEAVGPVPHHLGRAAGPEAITRVAQHAEELGTTGTVLDATQRATGLTPGKARALLNGRYHVSVSDIRALARPVLRHRIIPNFYAESEKVTSDILVDRLIEAVPAPRSGM